MSSVDSFWAPKLGIMMSQVRCEPGDRSANCCIVNKLQSSWNNFWSGSCSGCRSERIWSCNGKKAKYLHYVIRGALSEFKEDHGVIVFFIYCLDNHSGWFYLEKLWAELAFGTLVFDLMHLTGQPQLSIHITLLSCTWIILHQPSSLVFNIKKYVAVL